MIYRGIAALLVAVFTWTAPTEAIGQEIVTPPPALGTVLDQYPEPTGLVEYVADQTALEQLGKALFWDMQVGSDGIQACASCHFHAGADNRTFNQANPGPDGEFEDLDPGRELLPTDFPLHKLRDFDDRHSFFSDSDDALGSQGIVRTEFLGLQPGESEESGSLLGDPDFTTADGHARQVTGRNSPTVINALFNHQNFWDGRADNIFNGVSPFGDEDPNAQVYRNDAGTLTPVTPAMDFSSLASQAVGPIGSDVEMAYVGRTPQDLGRKLLPLPPLAKQVVHFNDSMLGAISNHPARGLNPTTHGSYQDMVEAAFLPQWWDNTTENVNGYSQIEANFTLFWGLALQAYQRTLISDDTKYDRVQMGLPGEAFTAQEQRGLDIFLGEGKCIDCHSGPEFTSATTRFLDIGAENPFGGNGALENMQMRGGRVAVYDLGFYNIGVRPTAEDLGRGGTDPFGNPLSWTLTDGVDLGLDPANAAVDGAFKTPGLRNVELTGPYLHTGTSATLMDVVDFYARGSDFFEQNLNNLSPEIGPDAGGVVTTLIGDQADKEALVAFMLTLTDGRVKNKAAPFDHPQLFLPIGIPTQSGLLECTQEEIFMGNCDQMDELPAVGSGGLSALALPRPELEGFMNLDPFARSVAMPSMTPIPGAISLLVD
jgi:cytochrome c peroxidase